MSTDNDGSGLEYDANVAPHPERWLALDESERLAAEEWLRMADEPR